MKKSVRAQSEIISTILLILIGLVLAVILLNFATMFFKNQTATTQGFSPYYDAKIQEAVVEKYEGLEFVKLVATRMDNEDTETIAEQIYVPNAATMGNEAYTGEAYLTGAYLTQYTVVSKSLTGTRFVLEDNNGASYSCDSEAPASPGEAKIYELSTSCFGISDFTNAKKISISFLYKDGKSTKILDEADVVFLSSDNSQSSDPPANSPPPSDSPPTKNIYPDLIISNISFIQSNCTKVCVLVSTIVKNIGNDTANVSTTRLQGLNTTNVLTKSLISGETYWFFSNYTCLKAHRFNATADVYNVITESNEENNFGNVYIPCNISSLGKLAIK
jgi:hypothetical protein